MSFPQLIRRGTSRTQSAFLVLLPHGGQNLARRNAWTSMAVDADRARARVEAAAAMSLATASQAASA